MLRRLIAAGVIAAGASRGARAQTGTGFEAPELALPTGARIIGMGQAGAATVFGSEALLWNPAGLARASRELSFGFVSNVPLPVSDLSLAFVLPVPKAAVTFAVGLRYLNEGEQPAVDSSGIQTGSLFQSGTTLTATFAAPFGDRFNLGVSLKVLKIGFSCTGTCILVSGTPVTGAFDAGAQYAFTKDSLVMIGVAVRNVGLPLQIEDAPQADQLPGRFDFGAAVSPRLAQYPGAKLIVAGDVVSRLNGEGGIGLRFGAELSWLNQYFGRAGYVYEGPNGSGPTFGLGVTRGRWRVDFSQFVSDFGGGTGSKPTYLTLRYVF